MTEHNDKLTCTSETCAKADDLVVKAEYTPKANDTVSTQFYLTRSMERTNNAFGLVSSEVDTHMMRNSEWGAVAYLSHSVYGINDEIRLNNYWGSFQLSSNSYSNTAYVTGRGACEVDADYTGHWEITYFGGADSGSCDEYDGDLLYPQSTTGNITGIFDMSGGTYENVMGYYIGANSNYASNPSKYFGWTDEENLAGFTKSIDSKYWDQYTKEGQSYIKTACNGSVCYGHALSEQFWGSYDYNWYNDSKSWVSAAYPWVQRGGYAESGSSAGIFAFSRDNGENDYYKSWRTVIFSFDN